MLSKSAIEVIFTKISSLFQSFLFIVSDFQVILLLSPTFIWNTLVNANISYSLLVHK